MTEPRHITPAEKPERRAWLARPERSDGSDRDGAVERDERATPARKATYWRDPFFVVLIAFALVKAVLMRYLALGDRGAVLGAALEVSGIVLLLAVADLLPRRRSYTLDIVVYTFLSAAMFGNTLYTNYYDQLFDPRMLSVARQVTTVGDVVTDLLSPIHLLFAADIPLLAGWALYLRRRAKSHAGRRDRLVVAMAALALVGFGLQAAYVLRMPHDVGGLAASRKIGLGAFQVVNTLRGANAEKAVAEETAKVTQRATDSTQTAGQAFQQTIDGVRKGDDGERLVPFSAGAFEGKNVIIIQVEALQNFIIGERIGGAEITPNLNKLAEESYYFPNTYSETGAGNTSDAEFIVNSGLLPPATQPAATAYVNRAMTSMPKLLREKGYDTFTLHQNEVHYWNRKELYASLGFTRYYDRKYFKNRDAMWNGSSDEVLFEDGLQVLQRKAEKGTPFYAQFITLSSHTPFTYVPANRRPLQLPRSMRGSLAADYVTAESYTDKAIGEFVAGLKRSGLWDESIVILYGDHMALKTQALHQDKGDSSVITNELLGRSYGAPDYQRVPLMIHVPGQSDQQIIEGTQAQIDIMPTVADLLGVDISGTPHVGRSVFVGSDGLAPLRAYYAANSLVNDRMVIRPGLSVDDGDAWTLDDCVRVEPTALDRADYERARRLSDLSAAWVDSLPVRPDAGDPNEGFIPTDKKNWGKKL